MSMPYNIYGLAIFYDCAKSIEHSMSQTSDSRGVATFIWFYFAVRFDFVDTISYDLQFHLI